MKLYEGMFVIDAGRVARDWEGTRDAVLAVLEKHGAAKEQGWRFEERKLAYPIQGVRRGVYLLQYFQCDPEAIAEMRVDLNLSEYILRYMILRVESGVAPETPTLGTATPQPAEAAIPGKEPPAEKKPVEEKKPEEKKPEEKKPEEKPAEEKPAEEAPADEKPAEDAPAEEKPADEKPAEEAPAEEKPAEEKPAEEKPAEEAPVEEKPAEEADAEAPAEKKEEEA